MVQFLVLNSLLSYLLRLQVDTFLCLYFTGYGGRRLWGFKAALEVGQGLFGMATTGDVRGYGLT